MSISKSIKKFIGIKILRPNPSAQWNVVVKYPWYISMFTKVRYKCYVDTKCPGFQEHALDNLRRSIKQLDKYRNPDSGHIELWD